MDPAATLASSARHSLLRHAADDPDGARDGTLRALPVLWRASDASLLYSCTYAYRDPGSGNPDQSADSLTHSPVRYWSGGTHRRICGRGCHVSHGDDDLEAAFARSRRVLYLPGFSGAFFPGP